MAKIDEVKEHIAALRGYLNIIIAIILALGAGVSKLYLSQELGALFWSGIGLILTLLILFSLIIKSIHKNIDKLKDI
ncbi:MAG: hypothetical protein COA44_01130 [Arcobacter sp.]|nr:MAG: hypothetical protein COA44_01130 [Arcobacter sp.]